MTPGDGAGDRLRRRQHDARRDAPPVGPPRRGRGPVEGHPAHAGYFSDANRDVLSDPRVAVYVNDGRHHLQMQPAARYDLITLEPPPIAYAGVAALYSREFYALARTRLKPDGYISQWLPAYQVPAATTLAMIRAFIDVFPQAVLLSGAEADLLLLGANDSRHRDRSGAGGRRAGPCAGGAGGPARLDLGNVREIVGTFVGSAQTLAEATRDTAPVTDDRPIQEYGVASLLTSARPCRLGRRPDAGCRVVPGLLRGRQAGSARRRARHLSGASRSRLRCARRRSRARAARRSAGPGHRRQRVSRRDRSRVGGPP